VSESPEPTPLSAEEEAKFRKSVAMIGPDDEGIWWSNFAAARLLATLDAARATVPAGPERSCCDERKPHYHGTRWVPARHQAVPAADDRERLRERVWSAQHDLSCSEMPPHPWTDHLPWDAPEDEQDAIREADAIIEAVRAGVSPSTGDAEHALHFDPDCEECAYLARPTRETLGSPPTGDASLREAAQRVSDKASVIARGGASPRWVVDDATFSALRAALSTGDADRLHEAIRAVYYEDKHPDLSGGLTTDPADARLAAAILRRLG
jgi:hypothetical protein